MTTINNATVESLITSFVVIGGKYYADLIKIFIDGEQIYISEDPDLDEILSIFSIINENNHKKITIRCSRAMQGDTETETLILDFTNNIFILHDHFTNSDTEIL